LVGELGQCLAQRRALLAAYGSDRRLERGWCEVVLLGRGSGPEAVADSDRAEAMEPADLSGCDGGGADPVALPLALTSSSPVQPSQSPCGSWF